MTRDRLLIAALTLSAAITLIVACGGSKPVPAMPDSGVPPEVDAGNTEDAGTEQDAGFDAGTGEDAGFDGGTEQDGGETDGGVDAGLDAGLTPVTGQLALHEITVNGQNQLGEGLFVTASFLPERAMVLDTSPGTPLGCKVWQLTAAEAGSVGLDEGAVSIAATDGSPTLPTCRFSSAEGYQCVSRSGTGGTLSATGTPGVYAFTNATANFAASDVGAYLEIKGALNAGSNGLFPIVAVTSASTIAFATSSSVVAAVEATATWRVLHGVGPTPGVTDPGFLADSDSVTFTLTPADGGQVAAINTTVQVGDDFSLDVASQARISAIPVDGTEFTLACDSANSACGTATRTRLLITTTDAPISTGAAPYDFPAPVTKQVVVQCAALVSNSITVPPIVSAYLQGSGATRIQAVFAREGASLAASPTATTDLSAGHAVVGFTDP